MLIIEKKLRLISIIFLIWCVRSTTATGQSGFFAENPDIGIQINVDVRDTNSIRELIEETEKWQHTNPDSAIKNYLTVVQWSKEKDYLPGLRDALQSLGGLFASRGMYDASMVFFTEMHHYCSHTLSMLPCLPIVYNAIATLHHAKGTYRQAANYYYRSITLNERLGLPKPIGAYNNLAAVLMTLGQHNEALHYLDLAESSAKETKRHALLGTIVNNKGQVWLTQGNLEKSIESFKRALEIGQEQNNAHLSFTATTNIGTWHLWQKQYKEALNWYFKDTARRKDVDPLHVVSRYQNIGNCFVQLTNYPLAERYLRQALTLAEKLDIRKSKTELHYDLGQVYEAQKQWAKALQHYKAHMTLKDSVASIAIVDNAQQLNIKFKTAEKDRQIAISEQKISMQEANLKKKNLWIGGITSGLLLSGFALFFAIRNNQQRQRNHRNQLYILQQQQQIERLNALMEGEELERTRIARDLHDGIGGMLAALKMNFTTLQHEINQQAFTHNFLNRDELDKIREMLDRTGDEIRKTAHNLMPDILVRHGLVEAIKVFCDNVNAGNQLYVNLQISGYFEDLSSSFQLAMYRVIQELIQNILKHSQASNALLHVSRTGQLLTIIAKDNGRGFDVEHATGLGLKNIQSRTHTLNGRFVLNTAVGAGTRVEISFDVDKINKLNP